MRRMDTADGVPCDVSWMGERPLRWDPLFLFFLAFGHGTCGGARDPVDVNATAAVTAKGYLFS